MDLKCIWLTVITVFKKDNAEITEQGIREEIEELKEYSNYKNVV